MILVVIGWWGKVASGCSHNSCCSSTTSSGNEECSVCILSGNGASLESSIHINSNDWSRTPIFSTKNCLYYYGEFWESREEGIKEYLLVWCDTISKFKSNKVWCWTSSKKDGIILEEEDDTRERAGAVNGNGMILLLVLVILLRRMWVTWWY